jgi:hypothetical protein
MAEPRDDLPPIFRKSAGTPPSTRKLFEFSLHSEPKPLKFALKFATQDAIRMPCHAKSSFPTKTVKKGLKKKQGKNLIETKNRRTYA